MYDILQASRLNPNDHTVYGEPKDIFASQEDAYVADTPSNMIALFKNMQGVAIRTRQGTQQAGQTVTQTL